MSEASRASGRRPNQGRVGTVVNGKWQIDARIGSGGMATVYAATHRNGHRAALKMLHTQLSRDESTRARFLREGYVANAVGHPAVVRVEDDGITEDGAAFLVLELLEGETLEARRTRLGGAMPIDDVLDVADHALDALAAAHEKGIVHRDVKPDNVFVTWHNEVKLLDFGLARMKHMQAEITKTGVTIGTPEFMAPEQAQGRRDDVDAISDIWALGATVFTAITGKYVHDAMNLHEQLIASATKRPRSVRALAPHVPASVAVVIDRALELDRKDRWESAREMQRALRAARAPRSDSDRLVADSLTLPAASPASLRRAGPAIPESGPRPSGLGLSIPSSGPTLQIHAPVSDPTIQEAAPATIHLDELPLSSGGPMSPIPHTERLTGAGNRGSGALLQAQSQHAQAIADALATQQSTQQLVGPSRQLVPGRHDSTLPSPLSPPLTGPHVQPVAPVQPTLASTFGSAPPQLSGSGAHPSLASGVHQTTLSSSGGYPSLDPQTGTGPARNRVATGPAPPPPPLATAPSPVSLRVRRSSRRVVIISVLLILVCAAIGAWVLLHPGFITHR